MSGQLQMATIFAHPTDYPDHFVVRGFTIEAGAPPQPNQAITLHESLADARLVASEHGQRVRIVRDPEDDPVIVESWI